MEQQQQRTVDSLSRQDYGDSDDSGVNPFLVFVALVIVALLVRGYMRYMRVQEKDDDDDTVDAATLTVSDAPSVHPQSSVMLTNPNMHPNHRFCKQWQLPEDDRGAFTFTACAPSGGLVIYLSTQPDNATLSDARGYAIVLDDQQDPPRSYIGVLPRFEMPDNRNSTSRINRGFRLNAARGSCQRYWVLYDNGNVLVGEGAFHPGAEASLIVCRDDSMNDPPLGVRYFGFGTLRREEEGISVSNIATYDAPVDEMRLRTPLQCTSAVAGTML